jgi:hypothetical protein
VVLLSVRRILATVGTAFFNVEKLQCRRVSRKTKYLSQRRKLKRREYKETGVNGMGTSRRELSSAPRD